MSITEALPNIHDRRRLRWRARRGMLENDILLTRFLDRYEETLSDAEVTTFVQLLELADGDLMDLLMARKQPEGELATEQVRNLLAKINAS